MSPNLTVNIKNSLATQLLSVVFSFYFIFATTVTLTHMVAEFYNTKEGIAQELVTFQKTFEPGLSNALWNIDQPALNSIIDGIIEVPSIVGLIIIDSQGTQMGARGIVPLSTDQNASPQELTNLEDLFGHEFTIIFKGEDGHRVNTGKGFFYSSTSVIIGKVKLGFMFIIMNAILKTIALWVIFLWVGRSLLSRPLAVFTTATEQLNLDRLEATKIDLKTKGRNELKILEEAFNIMIQKLLHARNKYEEQNLTLKKADKLKDEFIANLSHELRTPMTGILGLAELLSMGAVEDEEEKQEYYQNILQDSQRLIRILNNVINISLFESGSKEVVWGPVSFKELAETLEYTWEEKLGDHLVIDFLGGGHPAESDLGEDHPEEEQGFESDANLLKLLFNELIQNSLMFNRNEPKIKISVHVRNERVVFEIEDNGIGISEEHFSKIFNKFYRVESDIQYEFKGGIGLGLTVVKEATEILKGTVSVESTLEKGSLFSVEFPKKS